jgi:cell division protein FtsB
LALVITGYLLFSAGGNLVESYRLADDEDRLRAQVEELHYQEGELEQIRDYLRTDEYIEFMARRVFGLVKRGEALVVVQSPPAAPADEAVMPGRTWWQRLFSR